MHWRAAHQFLKSMVSLDRIGSVGALIAALAAPCCFPLFAAVGALSCLALAYHFYAAFSLPMLYTGSFGLLVATLWNYLSGRKAPRPILSSVVTCPDCGHRSEETMPTNACLFFYDCPACAARLKPKPGQLLRLLQLRFSAVSADSGW